MNISLLPEKSPQRKQKYPIPEQATLLQELERMEKQALAWEMKAHEMALEAAKMAAVLHRHGLRA